MRRARVLLADPPWTFGDKLPGAGRGAAKHYGCLSLAEICTFPLPPIADDAWLFLWRVGTQQREAIAVARAWGFSDPTSEIVWVKTTDDGQRPRMGMGRTVRNCHEVCLVCRRGKPERLAANVPSVIFAPRGWHSAKPDEFYSAIERLADGPRVEIFARVRRPGWECFGNELPAEEATGSIRQRTTSAEACAAVACSDDPRELVRVAFEHWDNIGWPEDKGPVALLKRALELLGDA